MSILRRSYADCSRRMFWPLMVICPLTWATLVSQPKLEAASADMAMSLGLWLHLPAILLSAAAIAAALECWPLLARGVPGSKHLHRLPIGPLEGCGAAITAALLALACALALVAVFFDWVMGSEGRARDAAAITVAEQKVQAGAAAGVFDPRTAAPTSLQFSLPDALEVDALQLRPQATLATSGEYEPTGIRVYADAELLTAEPLLIGGSHELLSLDFPGRRIQNLEIRCVEQGSFRVAFPEGTITSRSTERFPSWLNSALAALFYLFPTALALTAICLIGREISQALALALALVILLASTLADLTPQSAALQAYSRGQWLPTAGLGYASLLTVAVMAGMLILAIPLRRGGQS